MLFYIAAIILTSLAGVAATVLRPKAQPPVLLDDDAARKAAILARIRKIGVAPDDLHLLQR